MSRKCDLTGKKPMFGGNRKHRRGSSGGGGAWQFKSQRTAHKWIPNLRKVKLTKSSNGKTETLKISMKAYKKLRKDGKFEGYTLTKKKLESKS